jgi:proteic killer suppression protein
LQLAIISIKHKGLKLLWTKGDRSNLPSLQLRKIERIVTIIDALEIVPDDLINLKNLNPHKLSGSFSDYWSIWITGNYRIIFKFDNQKREAFDLDYLDYH